MSSTDRAVTYDDGIPPMGLGPAPYPEGLGMIASALAELQSERMAEPGYMRAQLPLALDLIFERFRGFHETHRKAQTVHAAYRAGRSQYCVYLRSFALAGTVISTHLDGPEPGQALGFSAGDRSFAEIVRASLPAGLESVSFINTFELYPSSDQDWESSEYLRRAAIPSFRLLSHNWRHVVREVIRGADFVVLNAGHATAGVSYELQLLGECEMAARTIVVTSSEGAEIEPTATGTYADVIDFGVLAGGLAEGPSSRLAAGIRSLAADDHRQVNEVEDLSKLECWVVDRKIDLAVREFGSEFLWGIPYENYVPSSLAPVWSVLSEEFPLMLEEWRQAEAVEESGESPTISTAARLLTRAMNVLHLATLLERYYDMALALSAIGISHRAITDETEVMVTCFRHGAQSAAWCKEPELAEFLSDALARLKDEVASGDV